jgi:hypothetical protein
VGRYRCKGCSQRWCKEVNPGGHLSP